VVAEQLGVGGVSHTEGVRSRLHPERKREEWKERREGTSGKGVLSISPFIYSSIPIGTHPLLFNPCSGRGLTPTSGSIGGYVILLWPIKMAIFPHRVTNSKCKGQMFFFHWGFIFW
jgi:hypothetical protein